MFLYKVELKTNIGKMTCEVGASSEDTAFVSVRNALRREAPSIRVSSMKVTERIGPKLSYFL